MPNTTPPIRNLEDATAYKERIVRHLPASSDFKVLMTIYLTDNTTPEEISMAKASGIVYAAKLYPKGATTNSALGVTKLDKIDACLVKMAEVGMPLLVHGEVTDPDVDIFDREAVFIERLLGPLVARHPCLKVVMEHITTEQAVQFVLNSPPNVAATITAHHLLYNRNALFKGGICPHFYCLPILKRERHRLALVKAATTGGNKFFLGTDSAPHAVGAKESACGCAGVFTAHAAVELYAEIFDKEGCLDVLEAFCSHNGADFYGLPRNTRRLTLKRESWTVPQVYTFGEKTVQPLRAGEEIKWTIE